MTGYSLSPPSGSLLPLRRMQSPHQQETESRTTSPEEEPLAPPRRRTFYSKKFEQPMWLNLAIHLLLCILTYPWLLGTAYLARDIRLFFARAVVSIGCGVAGVSLGISLVELASRYIEAATWATLINQTKIQEGSGIRLRDFARSASDSKSPFSALRLLWTRSRYPGTQRRNRKTYDARFWSVYITFALFLALSAASMPFLLGRMVSISIRIRHETVRYREVAVIGGVTQANIAKAKEMMDVFNAAVLTWTLTSFSSSGGIPPAVVFQSKEEGLDGDLVYFAETSLSQLVKGGKGFGTFDDANTEPTVIDSTDFDVLREPSMKDGLFANLQPEDSSITAGRVVEYPRWGIRVHCEKIPATHIMLPTTRSSLTYVFTPRAIIEKLFSSFKMPYPETFPYHGPTGYHGSDGTPGKLNVTTFLVGNDTFPAGLNEENLGLAAAFGDNGVAHSFQGIPTSIGRDGKGIATLETVLVRLNNTFTPHGRFPVLGPPVNGTDSRIGYDAAICLELFEPYVTQVYNQSSTLPRSVHLMGKMNEVKDSGPRQRLIKDKTKGIDASIPRVLSSENLESVYVVAHGNGVNQLLKDNSKDSLYSPSPTLISFTDGGSPAGKGPEGYTELSAIRWGKVKATSDAQSVLPYLVGDGEIVARVYQDRTLANAEVVDKDLAFVLSMVFLLGLCAALFVPTLPLSVPRRGFELYSWLAAFHGTNGELLAGEQEFPKSVRDMHINEIEKATGDLKVRYVF